MLTDYQEDIDTIRRCLRDLNASLPQYIDAIEHGILHKPLMGALRLRESLIHRVAFLGSDALSLIESERYVSAAIIVRSVLETTAVMIYFDGLCGQFLSNGDRVGLWRAIGRLSVGSKDSEGGFPPMKTGTIIEAANKAFPGYKKMYERLCEYTHCNWSGVLGAFSKLDGQYRATFGGDSKAALGALPALAAALETFIHTYDECGDRLSSVSLMLDEQKAKKEQVTADPGLSKQ